MNGFEIELVETDARDKRFQALCQMLDDEYFRLFGEKALQYKDVNRVEEALAVLLLMEGETVMGGGCMKHFDEVSVELKRIVVAEERRRNGYGGILVNALEEKAVRLGYQRAVLETGREMPRAIALYQKHGYAFIPNYGSFDGDENVVCMGKEL